LLPVNLFLGIDIFWEASIVSPKHANKRYFTKVLCVPYSWWGRQRSFTAPIPYLKRKVLGNSEGLIKVDLSPAYQPLFRSKGKSLLQSLGGRAGSL
jgi:hypothetical protein